jgi:hypothetical protein
MTETQTSRLHVWSQGGKYITPSTQQSHIELIPPAIYTTAMTPQGWLLERTAERFEFPYKLYGVNNSEIMKRVDMAWASDSVPNLGILLNGLKGTGKSVTAQMIANLMIDMGVPVLNIRGYTPWLHEILLRAEQPIAIVFDEFEKTHADKEEQQALLSTLDGMTRTKYKRMFVFTTNEMAIDTNMIDRPSRIRYIYQFGRLSNAVIEELIDDLLDPELAHLRGEVSTFISTRRVCSIDAAKTVILETNISKQAPQQYEPFLNLSRRDLTGLRVQVISRNGLVELRSHMMCSGMEGFAKFTTTSGRQHFQEAWTSRHETWSLHEKHGTMCLSLVSPGTGENDWYAKIRPSLSDTWLSKFPAVVRYIENYFDNIMLDRPPEDWSVPKWTRDVEALPIGSAMPKELVDQIENYFATNTIYGTPEPGLFHVILDPVFEPPSYNQNLKPEAY